MTAERIGRALGLAAAFLVVLVLAIIAALLGVVIVLGGVLTVRTMWGAL